MMKSEKYFGIIVLPTMDFVKESEKATNPFLQVLEPDIVEAIRTHTGLALSTQSANFEALRNWKIPFKEGLVSDDLKEGPTLSSMG